MTCASQQRFGGNPDGRLPAPYAVLTEGNRDAIHVRALSRKPPAMQDLMAGHIDGDYKGKLAN